MLNLITVDHQRQDSIVLFWLLTSSYLRLFRRSMARLALLVLVMLAWADPFLTLRLFITAREL